MIERNLTASLTEELQQSRVAALLGARQVGKSTLASIIASRRKMHYITFDNRDSLNAAKADPIGFVSRIERACVIDEVQRAPDILLAIKERVDLDDSPGQFLLTGSADILTLKTVADTLPGRAIYLNLFPFSQGELKGKKESLIPALFADDPPLITDAPIGHQNYAELIVKGGYPEAVRRRQGTEPAFFFSYVNSLLEREAEFLDEAGSHEGLLRTLRLAVARSGSISNYSSAANDLGLSDKTVRNYLRAFEKLFVLFVLQPWYRNLGHRVIKSPKVYVNDTGLLCAFTDTDVNSLSRDAIDGMYLETFIINEIIKQRSWESKPLSIYYYRDKAKREIDLILERYDGSLVAIEIKSSATVTGADFSTMRYFKERTGDKFKCGVVVYAGRETLPFGDRLYALPIKGVWAS